MVTANFLVIIRLRRLACMPYTQRRKTSTDLATDNESQKIVILGSGIMGLSTAHFLLSHPSQKQNLTIELIDQHQKVARGASKKNGQLLCPSLSYSWTSMPILFGKDALVPGVIKPWLSRQTHKPVVAFDWNLALDRKMWSFGVHWLLKKPTLSTPGSHIKNIMEYSMKCFDNPSDTVIKNIKFGRLATGTKTKDGNLATSDSSGDIGLFCNALADKMSKYAEKRVVFKLGKTVDCFEVDGNKIVAVTTKDEKGDTNTYNADKFVMAMGTGSSDVCRSIGVQCPIFPVKGYLVTIASNISIPYNCELSNKAFVSPLGDGRYRLSGVADFVADYDESTSKDIDVSRVDALIEAARAVFPDLEVIDVDCCYRPVAADDIPMIGPTSKFHNLYMCTGHGSKGWTMGLGSGKLLADLMLGATPEIDHLPYSPRRFDLFFS